MRLMMACNIYWSYDIIYRKGALNYPVINSMVNDLIVFNRW